MPSSRVIAFVGICSQKQFFIVGFILRFIALKEKKIFSSLMVSKQAATLGKPRLCLAFAVDGSWWNN